MFRALGFCLAFLALAPGLTRPAAAQGGPILVIEPYDGPEEREGNRVEQAFGRGQRVTGYAHGAVLAAPFEGRIPLTRYRNPAGRSAVEIVAHYKAARAARGFTVEWACNSRPKCGMRQRRGWRLARAQRHEFGHRARGRLFRRSSAL